MKLDPKYLLTRIPESSNIDKDLANEMMGFMRRHKGIGLAANQVGHQARLFVMDVNVPRRCFNPRVVWFKEDSVNKTIREGCLSYPKRITLVPRYLDIIVQYINQEGNYVETRLQDLEALCFQHELEHLSGKDWSTNLLAYGKI